MSTGPNRLFDEFARMMTDAAGAAQGVAREAETIFKAQAERAVQTMDLVQRDDFDAMQDMAVRALEENDALRERIEALEARLEALEKAEKPKTRATKTAKTTD